MNRKSTSGEGELLLMRDASNTAEASNVSVPQSSMSRQHRARSWELRATISLAAITHQATQARQARAMLAETYGWFTEGFDTADLKDARALLEEPSR